MKKKPWVCLKVFFFSLEFLRIGEKGTGSLRPGSSPLQGLESMMQLADDTAPAPQTREGQTRRYAFGKLCLPSAANSEISCNQRQKISVWMMKQLLL